MYSCWLVSFVIQENPVSPDSYLHFLLPFPSRWTRELAVLLINHIALKPSLGEVLEGQALCLPRTDFLLMWLEMTWL